VAESQAFGLVAAELERRSGLNRLEARGTLRVALKSAALDAAAVSALQMHFVVDRLLATELRIRGVLDAETLCETLLTGLDAAHLDASPDEETPEQVFGRILGR
jgi:hypothetical protein